MEYGLRRPKFRQTYKDLSAFIRFTPDFLCEGKENKKFLVECKGCGRDVLKIKLETMDVMEHWTHFAPLWFFIYNSSKNQYALVTYRALMDLCEAAEIKEFSNDHKKYYHIPTGRFEWQAFKPQEKETNDTAQRQAVGY